MWVPSWHPWLLHSWRYNVHAYSPGTELASSGGGQGSKNVKVLKRQQVRWLLRVHGADLQSGSHSAVVACACTAGRSAIQHAVCNTPRPTCALSTMGYMLSRQAHPAVTCALGPWGTPCVQRIRALSTALEIAPVRGSICIQEGDGEKITAVCTFCG